jgi:hypothetical protein
MEVIGNDFLRKTSLAQKMQRKFSKKGTFNQKLIIYSYKLLGEALTMLNIDTLGCTF